ncbi:uncharacterized protein LOC144671995 [Cetorhinus maximus]
MKYFWTIIVGVFLSNIHRNTWFPKDEAITTGGFERTGDERGQSLTKIMALLAKSTDAEIRRITESHCGLLQNTIEKFMEHFLNENVFSESAHETISTRAESPPRCDVSRLIIDKMLDKGAHGERELWALLHKLQESKHKGTWPDMECSNAKILQKLAGYTDAQLHRITFWYRHELEQSIEEFVEEFSQSLARAKILTEEEHKRITSLAESHSHYEASKISFDILLEKNATDERAMWSILFKLQKYKPKLKNTLLEIERTGFDCSEIMREQHRTLLISVMAEFLLGALFEIIAIICCFTHSKCNFQQIKQKTESRGVCTNDSAGAYSGAEFVLKLEGKYMSHF